MLDCPCRVLLVEDEPEDIDIVKTMLQNSRSAFFRRGFKLACAETLSEAKRILCQQEFDVILLDLMLPDSRNMNGLEELQVESQGTPIIVQTALEDEVVAVRALELGACGYLPKVASDRNLLLYAIRSAIERQQQLASLEKPQQQELDSLEDLMTNTADFQQDNPLKQRMPDIFAELEQRYYQLLERYVEQKIYKVEYQLSGEINIFIEQLGYLQANPRDLIEIHTTVLKQKQLEIGKKSKVFTVEGRYLLLEVMGKLTTYYRRYYVGLNKFNFRQNYQNTASSG